MRIARSVASALLPLAAFTLAACSSDGSGGGEATCSDQGAALSVCASGATVPGVDVSTYQGAVDWAAVKKAGKAFAFARISDGTGHIDDQFARNWKEMKANGVMRGAYQFFRPEEDPTQQADLVVAQLQAAGGLEAGDLPVVMDMEVTDNVATATIQANMRTWLGVVTTKTGRKPLLYTAAFMSSAVGTGFTGYPLWVANYGVSCPTMPANFTAWKFWQSSSTGSVGGISGDVDVDEFNGSLADLVNFAGGDTSADAAAPPPAAHDAGTAPSDAGAVATSDGGASGGGAKDAGAVLGSGGDAGRHGAGSGMGGGAAGPCL